MTRFYTYDQIWNLCIFWIYEFLLRCDISITICPPSFQSYNIFVEEKEKEILPVWWKKLKISGQGQQPVYKFDDIQY